MANKTILLCLLIFCTSLCVTECRRSGKSRSRSGSGRSWFSWSSGSSHKPASSSSGSSWWSSGSSGSSGTSSHTYPSSSSGKSGSSLGTHTYPPSGSGSVLSGSGSNNNHGSHDNFYKPTNTYNTHSGYGASSYHPGSFASHTYYHYPQQVYVTQYRDSGSRYGDLLTGLTFYNLGRSQSHHNHYYNDDYYRTRYNSQNQPRDEATCTLRIKENEKLQLLKIPCEIVSTFTEGSKKVNNPSETLINKTVCTTNTTVIKRIAPESSVNITSQPTVPPVNVTANVSATNATSVNITTGVTSNMNTTNWSAVVPNAEPSNVTSAVDEIVNVTLCTTMSTVDPLSEKGPPINPFAMECAIDIQTKNAYFRHNVDCETLLKYARMPPPKRGSFLLPERQKLKSWLAKPPWWVSMFIAV